MNQPPKAELSGFQRAQQRAIRAVKDAAALTSIAVDKTSDALRDFDKRNGVTDRVRQIGEDVDQRFHVSDKAKSGWNFVSETALDAVSTGRRKADELGATGFFTENVFDPIVRTVDTVKSSKSAQTVFDYAEGVYGTGRRFAVDLLAPDLPTYDSYELLQATKRELNKIAACILQVSPEESSQLGTQFSRAVTAKAAGFASTTALLSLIATFGHAGTGAAIAGLSGAAATSATMAWVGSLVGGGVVAGATLTGGLGIVIGLAAYKALASKPRPFDSLSDFEQRIVQSCWMLGAVADAYQKQPEEFIPEAAGSFLEKMLIPLHRDLSANMDDLCQPLDVKNAIAMRQHVLADFQAAVIHRLGRYLSWAHSEAGRAWHADLVAARRANGRVHVSVSEDPHGFAAILRAGQVETAIGGVFAALLTRKPLDDSTESRLVLDALRRSSTELHDASQEKLGDYLRAKSHEELRGVASNVKGIYHELWYVEQYNANNHETYARVFGDTNHPGADVQIVDVDTGEVKREIQLKAVESSSAVHGHFERYPDIWIVATNEVAAKIDDPRVDGSGVANEQLVDDVDSGIDAVRDHSVSARAGDTALFALGIASTAELMQMLRGELSFPEAIMNTAAKAGVAASATALTALLFG